MDWTLANQINYSEHNNELPYVTQIRLPQFPTDDFLVPGVGLAAANNHRFFVPVHGKTTHFDLKKVSPKETLPKIMSEQSGFGEPTPEVLEKLQISKEIETKRKLLGDPVFNLMSSPKIKIARLELVSPKKLKASPQKIQKGEGSSKVHIFKK
jgi:hypothetical protein